VQRAAEQFIKEASQTRPSVAIALSEQALRIARLAQIPFDFAQSRLSPRKERLLRMTILCSRGGLWRIMILKTGARAKL
jgi:hypothetical protein